MAALLYSSPFQSTLRGVVRLADTRSDAELLDAVARSDAGALGELAQRHQAKAIALAYRMLQRQDLAEDIAQEAFLRIWRHAPRYRGDARFTTWLYRIVSNLCLDHMRRAKRSPDELPEASVDGRQSSPEEPVETNELRAQVRRAVAALPERQRLVLILHRYEELTHAEIADVTGWSASAVESLLVRAYANLRQSLAGLA